MNAAQCDPVPGHLAQASCVGPNGRWIHPCWRGGAVFSVAAGYACPICGETFESQRDGTNTNRN